MNPNLKYLFTLVSFIVILSNVYAQDINEGLVAFYSFNGSATDSTINNNDGQVVNATLATDRFFRTNNAYDFNGSSSYIDIPDNVINQESGSVSLWININSINSSEDMVAFSSNAGLSNQQAGSRLYIRVSPDTTLYGWYHIDPIGDQINNKINFNEWHHACLTWTPDTSFFYLNTEKEGGAGGVLNQTELINIGSVGEGFDNFFDGIIDDVRIYNRAISDEEVQLLFDEDITSSTYDLVASRKVDIYPNPVSGEKVNISNDFNYIFSSIIGYDFQGRIILQVRNPNTNEININTLKPGVYNFRFDLPTGQFFVKKIFIN